MTEKKLSQFSHNVRKGRPVNTVMVNFNIIMGQMTEMSQQKKLIRKITLFIGFQAMSVKNQFHVDELPFKARIINFLS